MSHTTKVGLLSGLAVALAIGVVWQLIIRKDEFFLRSEIASSPPSRSHSPQKVTSPPREGASGVASNATGNSAVADHSPPQLLPEAAPAPTIINPPDRPTRTLPRRRASAQPIAPPVTSVPLPSAPLRAPSTPASASSSAPISSASSPIKEAEPARMLGCEEAEHKSGGQKGEQERFFAVPPEMVRRAAVSALDSLDFNIHKSSENKIEASKKRHIGVFVGAGGERVILTFRETEEAGHSGTLVIGQTKKSFVGRLAQRTWTDAVFAQIACNLRESSR